MNSYVKCYECIDTAFYDGNVLIKSQLYLDSCKAVIRKQKQKLFNNYKDAGFIIKRIKINCKN